MNVGLISLGTFIASGTVVPKAPFCPSVVFRQIKKEEKYTPAFLVVPRRVGLQKAALQLLEAEIPPGPF